MKNSKSEDKSHIIFNYSRITKNLFDTFMKLSLKVYNNLLNSRYKCLFVINLKYAYFIISLHAKNRYFFVFIISNIE